jgi:hypothetical protein
MRILLLALCACVYVVGWGQTSISGVVNTYHKVTNINTTDAVLTLDNANGLNTLDKVLIIQMKGADIETRTSGNAQYGSVKNLNNTGKYEIATICKVQGKNVTMVNKLANTYDVSNKVQLVKIFRYESALVTGKLEAASWDNTTGTGGILAIMVSNTLTLNAPISADGKGFKGGQFLKSGNYCVDNVARDYYYDASDLSPQWGASKGESIYELTSQITGGRGAIANGGGGGNNHNAGGAGGANKSKGGNGGNNTTTDGCRSDYPGIGGYALVSDNTRLFPGGGGGAGHGNNTVQTGGGNGGGIIFISARTVVSNGYSISANGQAGSNTIGDGASGGGAAGTIIMNVNIFADQTSIAAVGGAGGTIDNEGFSARCFGEGGGGSGGVIYFSNASAPLGVSVAGGVKGNKINSPGCGGNPGSGTSGDNGSIVTNYAYVQPQLISSGCPEAASLPLKLVYFKVSQRANQATAEWKVEFPEDAARYILQRRAANENWIDAYTIPAEERTAIYKKTDGALATGIYLYRLKIMEKNGFVAYSPIQQITIKAEDLNRLTIYPNPATNEINIVTPTQQDNWLNMYDMKGRLVYQKRITANDLVIKQDISFLQEGVYMIQVGKLTARFVVFK